MPRYARRTSGFRSSSCDVPLSRMRILEHVAAVGNGERKRHLLLGDEQCHALVLEPFERLERRLSDDRGKAGGRLVEHQELRSRHECATHGQHLLLTATQGCRLLALSLLQTRKEIVDELERLSIGPPGIRAQIEIALQGHCRKEVPLGGNVGDPRSRDAVGGTVREILSVQDDATRHRWEQPGDGPEQRRLACAIRADDCHRLAGANLDVDAVDHPFAEITGRQPGDLKQRGLVRDTRR